MKPITERKKQKTFRTPNHRPLAQRRIRRKSDNKHEKTNRNRKKKNVGRSWKQVIITEQTKQLKAAKVHRIKTKTKTKEK